VRAGRQRLVPAEVEQLLARLSAGSSSEIPAEALTISARGQYVIPSPYGRQRPTSTVASSSPATKSRESRLFPTPGSP
jgi:hypothetical protein